MFILTRPPFGPTLPWIPLQNKKLQAHRKNRDYENYWAPVTPLKPMGPTSPLCPLEPFKP